MHHVHVWQIDEQTTALEAHIAIHRSDLRQMEAVKERVKHTLATHFGIAHSTLEFEFGGCGDNPPADCFHHHTRTAAHASA